jgi:hypothetical protein
MHAFFSSYSFSFLCALAACFAVCSARTHAQTKPLLTHRKPLTSTVSAHRSRDPAIGLRGLVLHPPMFSAACAKSANSSSPVADSSKLSKVIPLDTAASIGSQL